MPRTSPTSARKRPVQARAQRTVDAILTATAHVLVRSGYEDLSTNRVAERAGVSIGSLYQYFPNKESLVAELLDRYSDTMFDMVVRRLSELGDASPAQLAAAMVRTMVETKREDPRLAKVLREQIPRTGRLARYERELSRVVELVEAYLRQHIDQLRWRELDRAAFLSVAMVDELTHNAVTQRPASEDEAMIEMITDATVRFLVRDDPRPAARAKRR